jgi:protein-S-isoprenylcysteine O-methyltransferase Ste14
MNGTRLTFAISSCLYLFVAVPFEEKDLLATFGRAYADYAKRVRWRIVPLVY